MNNKVNVCRIGLYCSSSSWGGLEKNIVELGIQLKEMGFSVSVFCLENSNIHNYAKENEINTQIIKRNWRYADVFNAYKLSRIISELKISHLIIRDPRDISLACISKFLSGKFFLIYYQAMQLASSKKGLFHRIRFSQLNNWICTSHFLKNQTLQLTSVKENKISVIPLFSNKKEFYSTKMEILTEFNLSSNANYIGCFGRIDVKKNQLLLLQAFNSIHKKFPTWKILLVGNTTQNEGVDYQLEIVKFAENLELQDKIIFKDYTSRIHELYRTLAIFVLPSHSETFGTVTIEAMSHGIPVLGSNTGATPEILQNKNCLFDPTNSTDLASKLSELMESETIRNTIGNQNLLKYELHYSKSLFQTNWLKTLKNFEC
ncbi:MAG: glycosyltransferase family 4 protein [Bacteroidota bacterium]